ncbi:MAG: hypothetical protein LWX55_11920 [Deltaproteobacteria bacterium]|jgi:hypothetical protein|nr:hypothetical protein [Deltaproteobacteria bacterium]
MNSSSLKIPKLTGWNPRKNLPTKISRKNKERDFTLSFARAYIPNLKSIHCKTKKIIVTYAREIPINGYGIADFVAVYRNKTNDNSQSLVSKIDSSVIRAFELKISDWRRAMMQAHRYRYFANSSIVVLHSDKLKNAFEYIDTFKKINVGLWAFNPISNKIITCYTPRPRKPLEPKYKPLAIELVTKASKSLHSS